MSVTSEMPVVIDESIRSVPALTEAVMQASNYLESHVRNGPPLSDPHEYRLAWKLGTNTAPESGLVIATFEERDASDQRVSEHFFPVTDILDPINRDIQMLRLWRHVLKFRSDQNMKRIDRLIRELELEERNGGIDAH